jgi:peptide chain release factor subunit 1
LIEIAAHEFFVKISDILTETFLNEKDLKGIIVGGPGATKEYLINEGYLHHELQKKVIFPLFDTGYTNEYGLRELVEKATDTLKDLSIAKEKRLIRKLLNEIRKSDGLAVYGDDVMNALQMGTVNMLLISEGLKKYRFIVRCNTCDTTRKFIAKTESSCPKCEGSLTILDKTDVVKEYCSIAEKMNTQIEFISADSEEGKIFLNAFGGIAGILRFKLKGM